MGLILYSEYMKKRVGDSGGTVKNHGILFNSIKSGNHYSVRTQPEFRIFNVK